MSKQKTAEEASDVCATLTVTEAAAKLGISKSAAYEAVLRKELPSIKIGRRVLVPRAALARLLESDRAA